MIYQYKIEDNNIIFKYDPNYFVCKNMELYKNFFNNCIFSNTEKVFRDIMNIYKFFKSVDYNVYLFEENEEGLFASHKANDDFVTFSINPTIFIIRSSNEIYFSVELNKNDLAKFKILFPIYFYERIYEDND